MSGRLQSVDDVPRLRKRKGSAHKGDFGRVLVLGGSRGMIGAPALAANAALRGGAGLVTVACPRSVQLAVATLCPCATSIPLPQGPAGMIDPKAATETLRSQGLLDPAAAPWVVAAGPGLGRGNTTFDRAWFQLLRRFVDKTAVPLVLDADGINALPRTSTGRAAAWDQARYPRTVITPHPGEMARLHDVTTAAVQKDRKGFAVRTAQTLSQGVLGKGSQEQSRDRKGAVRLRSRKPLPYGRGSERIAAFQTRSETPSQGADDPNARAVVVLKGAGTIVTDGARLYTERGGNPGMATGGSGDVLTGLIAALIGQGLPCFDAAILGVHVHARAGDLAALDFGQVSLIATDLIDYLSDAFDQLN